MKYLKILGVFVIFFGVSAYALSGVFAQTSGVSPVKPTTELHTLKVQNLQMKSALLQQQVRELQRQIQETSTNLETEWKSLEAELRQALSPPADWTFDRQQAAFVPPAPKE